MGVILQAYRSSDRTFQPIRLDKATNTLQVIDYEHPPMTSTRNNEIILRQNTKYILRITSGTNNNLTNVQLEWYEHQNIV